MVIDCVTYNGEADLFDLRYNILKDYVDEFIVVEFDKTFSGKDKIVSFPRYDSRYPKVRHFFVSEDEYKKYTELAESSPNTKGAEHWKREFMQKESIKNCLTHLKDDDIVYIGDCDEIWNPLYKPDVLPVKLHLKVYTYYLNNLSSESFFGPFCAPYGYIKDKCLNHERTNKFHYSPFYAGWHFTSMANSLEQKLKDSYTEEDYASPQVMNNLKANIENNKDFLGRDFTYIVDEDCWPQYLKDNKQKYIHLCK